MTTERGRIRRRGPTAAVAEARGARTVVLGVWRAAESRSARGCGGARRLAHGLRCSELAGRRHACRMQLVGRRQLHLHVSNHLSRVEEEAGRNHSLPFLLCAKQRTQISYLSHYIGTQTPNLSYC